MLLISLNRLSPEAAVAMLSESVLPFQSATDQRIENLAHKFFSDFDFRLDFNKAFCIPSCHIYTQSLTLMRKYFFFLAHTRIKIFFISSVVLTLLFSLSFSHQKHTGFWGFMIPLKRVTLCIFSS